MLLLTPHYRIHTEECRATRCRRKTPLFLDSVARASWASECAGCGAQSNDRGTPAGKPLRGRLVRGGGPLWWTFASRVWCQTIQGLVAREIALAVTPPTGNTRTAPAGCGRQ